jgi:RNA polymerase sigma-70 factor (ECF subfamily)
MTDMALCERAKSGDRKAFSELVIRHQLSLLRLCMRFTGSHDLAEDIVQEAFIKAFNKLDTFEGRSSFKSWLFQIAVNTAKNKLRTAKDSLSLDQIQISINEGSDKMIQRNNIREVLLDYVDQLPEKQKMALTMRVYEDLSFKEIAEIMDCPYDTAKANYRHGLMNIKKYLERDRLIDQLSYTDVDISFDVRTSKIAEL